MNAGDECAAVLRAPFGITCDSEADAKQLQKAFAETSSIDGTTVLFRRSMRIHLLPKKAPVKKHER